jgi:succinate dehydrogenase cytochrome b556 subunit
VFVWIFHRVSGVALIALMAFQLTTGFFQASYANSDLVKTMASLHKHRALNCVMVFLVLFHALYGVRTILMDLGVKAERKLFWACTILGSVLFVVFLALFVTMVQP